MKIVYIINKMHNLAGIERILSCKMNYLAENTDHQIALLTYEQQGEKLSFQLNPQISHYSIDAPIPERGGSSFLVWMTKYYNSRQLFRRQYQKLLAETRPDIVISTVYSYPILDIITHTAHQMGIKTIMESHVKGETVSMAKYQSNSLIRNLVTQWDRYLLMSLKDCNCIVTLTKDDAAFWKPYCSYLEVIPNIITVVPQKVIDYDSKRVIAAGRYSHQKGFDLLLEAWHLLAAQYPDWHLYIFGNEDRTPYEMLVDRYGMNRNVHLMPATKDITSEYAKSSVYVMSSRFEGFGLVLAEAMSCGLPCVSFDCPYGPRDIITDGEDGILVENGNIEELARQLSRLMADSALRQSMGEKAAHNITRYKPATIMKQWSRLFYSL